MLMECSSLSSFDFHFDFDFEKQYGREIRFRKFELKNVLKSNMKL